MENGSSGHTGYKGELRQSPQGKDTKMKMDKPQKPL